ncbi:sister chromatid cohesion 1 protein 1 [Malania oleifera]|uniref:sister chromatid cohesion 1 protein 1 n=1 Tax=Malania oleifera TaxID=397392 RepID=UPI0025ADFBE0|nr:sister chromatid cohesion 1 protein 1 [Malania oleifera]
MFYSHQLLARKAPLGQIWMAATTRAKINRRKLYKLNIIKICEEILYPSIPMALRLSGILMGGVVIVYERKVRLLYDDLTRLLDEINKAWKVKTVPDPTVLPKRKSQAEYEAVTLPENQETEIGDIEHSLLFSNSTTSIGFQQAAYFAMRLDNVDEPYVNSNRSEEDQFQHYHQADAANITLSKGFDSSQVDRGFFNRFERFDIEGDEEVQLNFTPQDHTQIPDTLIPSPPHQNEPEIGPSAADEMQNQPPDLQVNQQSDEHLNAAQAPRDEERQELIRRRVRRRAAFLMDYEQTVIPGLLYQSWLRDTSDIVSRRGRKRKSMNFMSTMKIANLMELPPVGLISGLLADGNREIYYPTPLLEQWMRSTKPVVDSHSGQSSLIETLEIHLTKLYLHFEDFHGGAGLRSTSIEKQRANLEYNEIPAESLVEELKTNLLNTGVGVTEANVMVTPGNSGDEDRSIPSSASGHDCASHNSHVISARLKRPYSSSRHGGSSLEPVAEENSWQKPAAEPSFKLTRLSEIGSTPEHELLAETAPTQTQLPIVDQFIDKITDSIRMHLKTHFDTPGAPQIESLENLASGMNRKSASQLFYQTCVLASRGFVRVEQKVAYGDILISRGAQM